MSKVFIFYGPKNEFKEITKNKNNAYTLTELASFSDSSRREFRLKVDGNEENESIEKESLFIEHLICYSEEYSGLTEGTIYSFLSFLAQFNIGEIYLQNPPLYIENLFNNANMNLEILTYEYSKISKEILIEINKKFSDVIIGQDDVKDKLLSSLYPLCNNKYQKPVVILFYGPSGVGKTETAKYISSVLEEKLFRKQLSMFHNEEFSSYIFGGKHSQSSLAKDLLERSSNVILFDEFDKPHPIFHSAFYQMFDEGQFEDKNYKVIMKNSIVVCTSNYKSEDEIKSHLGEPIFSRFDSIIRFKELNEKDIETIILKEYKSILEKLEKEEVIIVESSGIYSKVLLAVLKFKNVREVRRILKEAISYILVQKFIK